MSKMLTPPMLVVLKNAAHGCNCFFGVDSLTGSVRERRMRSLRALQSRTYIDANGTLTRSGAQALMDVEPVLMSDFAIGLLLPKASAGLMKRTLDLCDQFGLVPSSRYPSDERGGRLAPGPGFNQLANLISHVEREAQAAALVSMVSAKPPRSARELRVPLAKSTNGAAKRSPAAGKAI